MSTPHRPAADAALETGEEDCIRDPEPDQRLDQLAEIGACAERAAQEDIGIPWADGPDRTY